MSRLEEVAEEVDYLLCLIGDDTAPDDYVLEREQLTLAVRERDLLLAATQYGIDEARAELALNVVTPNPTPLAGEFSDQPTPLALARALGVTDDELDDLMEDLAEAYETGYFTTYEEARP